MATSSRLRSLATVAALVVVASCGSSVNQTAEQSPAQSTAPSKTQSSGRTGSTSPSEPSPTQPSTTAQSPPASSAAAEKPAEITIADFAFSGTRTVAPGTTITVTNEDAAFHSVTADDGSFDVVVKSRGGMKTFSAPTKPGRYRYICKYHPTMKGVLVVE